MEQLKQLAVCCVHLCVHKLVMLILLTRQCAGGEIAESTMTLFLVGVGRKKMLQV